MSGNRHVSPQADHRISPERREFPWLRFWAQSVLAALAFNVIAAIVTWHFILPRLFPAQ
jgi:hypothetical protein